MKIRHAKLYRLLWVTLAVLLAAVLIAGCRNDPPAETTGAQSTEATPTGTEEPTTAPEELTTEPEGTTTEPEGTTTAPEEPTTAPEEPTTAPEEPTTAPEEPTTAPEEITTEPEDTTAPPTPPVGPDEPAHDLTGTWKVKVDASRAIIDEIRVAGLENYDPGFDIYTWYYITLDPFGGFEVYNDPGDYSDFLLFYTDCLTDAYRALYNGNGTLTFAEYLAGIGMNEEQFAAAKFEEAAARFAPAGEKTGTYTNEGNRLNFFADGAAEPFAYAIYSVSDRGELIMEDYRSVATGAPAPVCGLNTSAPAVFEPVGDAPIPESRPVEGVDDNEILGTWMYELTASDLLGMLTDTWGGKPEDLAAITLRMYLWLGDEGRGMLFTTADELNAFSGKVADQLLAAYEKKLLAAAAANGQGNLTFDQILQAEGTTREKLREKLLADVRECASGAYFTYAVRDGKLYVSISMDTVYDTDYYVYEISGNTMIFTDLVTSYYPDPFGGALSAPADFDRTLFPDHIVDPGENEDPGSVPVDTTQPSDPALVGTWTVQMDYTDVLRDECAAQDVTLDYTGRLDVEMIFFFGDAGDMEIFIIPADEEQFARDYVEASLAVTRAFAGEIGMTLEEYLTYIGMTEEEYRAYTAEECRRVLNPTRCRYYANEGRIYIDYNPEFVGDANEYTRYTVSGDDLAFVGYFTAYDNFYTGFVPYYPFELVRAVAAG